MTRRATRQATDADGWDWTDRKNRTRRSGGPPKAGEGTRIKKRLAKQRRPWQKKIDYSDIPASTPEQLAAMRPVRR